MGLERLFTAWVAAALACAPLGAAAQEPAPIRTGQVDHVPGETAVVLTLAEGEVLSAGTCGLEGASSRGDTTLSLRAPSGAVVAESDDACGGLGSYLQHTADSAGPYSLLSGCYGGDADCGGVIAYRVGPPQVPIGVPALRVMSSARALVAVDRAGGGLFVDAALEWRPLGMFVVRLAGTPLGLGGGELGGIVAGSLSLVAGLSLDIVEIAIGGGAAVLGTRLGNPLTKEAGILALHARIGRLHMFHVDGQLNMVSVDGTLEGFTFLSAQLTARLPLGPVDLIARGAGGHDGIGLGELGVVIWLHSSAPARPVLGLSVHAGGGGVFYQPVCRFGAPCTDARWYAGPLFGAGIEWRP